MKLKVIRPENTKPQRILWYQKWWYLVVFAASLALSFLLYANTITGDFVYDDVNYSGREEYHQAANLLRVWFEPTLLHTNTTTGFRPLFVATWTLTFVLFGDSPIPFHITNIFMYGVVLYLVYRVIEVLSDSKELASITTLFYAVLPIHTESVANIKGRDDLLMTIFVCWSFLLLAKATRNLRLHWLYLLSSYIVFYLGLLSKEFTIVMPLFFLIWYWRAYRPKLIKFVGVGFGYGVMAGLLFLHRWIVYRDLAFKINTVEYIFNPLATANLATKIWTNFKITGLYPLKVFFPFSLSAGYQFNQLPMASSPFESPLVMWGVIFSVMLLGLLVFKRFRSTPVWYGVVFFLVAYIPVPKIFFQASDIFAERWMFLPSLGLSLIIAYLIFQVPQKYRFITFGIFSLALLLYGIRTIDRNSVWHNRETFLKNFVIDAPQSSHAHFLLAQYHYNYRNNAEMLSEINKAREIYPDNPRVSRLLGRVAIREGLYEDANRLLADYPLLDPYFTEEHYLFALTLSKLNRYADCIRYITERYGPRPEYPALRLVLGTCYFQMNDKEKANELIVWDEVQKGYVVKE